jgi:hypothetical protein
MFWNRRAGPPGFPVFDLLTRSVISAISRIGSASVFMRFSSPARSSAAIHWRRSSKGKGVSLELMIINSGQWAVVSEIRKRAKREMCRKKRDTYRGSPGSFVRAKNALSQDDNQIPIVCCGAW